jgi:hypothetical protein
MPLDAAGKRLCPCPECDTPMQNMGLDFKAPRQSDIRQWKKVEQLFAHGYAYHSCGCGPGPRPALLREVPEFLAEQTRRRAEWERQSRVTAREAERYKARNQRNRIQDAKRERRVLGLKDGD